MPFERATKGSWRRELLGVLPVLTCAPVVTASTKEHNGSSSSASSRVGSERIQAASAQRALPCVQNKTKPVTEASWRVSTPLPSTAKTTSSSAARTQSILSGSHWRRTLFEDRATAAASIQRELCAIGGPFKKRHVPNAELQACFPPHVVVVARVLASCQRGAGGEGGGRRRGKLIDWDSNLKNYWFLEFIRVQKCTLANPWGKRRPRDSAQLDASLEGALPMGYPSPAFAGAGVKPTEDHPQP